VAGHRNDTLLFDVQLQLWIAAPHVLPTVVDTQHNPVAQALATCHRALQEREAEVSVFTRRSAQALSFLLYAKAAHLVNSDGTDLPINTVWRRTWRLIFCEAWESGVQTPPIFNSKKYLNGALVAPWWLPATQEAEIGRENSS
jgi:hypothetical protein